jgi:DNA-binding SARP family transcriptional activator
MPPALQIFLLGTCQLRDLGQPLRLPQARLQALLSYLLLHRDAPLSRQQVAFCFWPDTGEAQAQANLRKALYDLRRQLPVLDRFLQIDALTLQWRSDAPFTLDVAEFEAALARAEQAGATEPRQAALEQAIACYTGDLLPECYDEWLLAARERLRQSYLAALEELVRLLEVRRDFRAAASYALQLLQADPLHEVTYRTLMQLYIQQGDRARALRVYHTCMTTLQEELGVEPSPETQAIYQQLLHLADVPVAPAALAPAAGTIPLIGRPREWAALQQAWQQAVQGQPHFVLIAGEPGIGKSRLADELRQWVERQGFAAAATRAYAAEGSLAYAPVADWLRSPALRPQVAQLDAVWMSEVARLLPELLVERPDLPALPALAESWQRRRLHEALAHAVGAGDRPLLLVLDDLQWCDEETLSWLHFRLRFAAQPRLLVVGTARLEEVAVDHPLLALARGLRQEGTLVELEVGPLDAPATAALAAEVAGQSLTAAQAAALYAQSEGSPLFVVEMVRAAGQDTMLDGALPPKVQAVLDARLAQLSPATRALAELAAVVGRAFAVEVLAQAHAADGGNEDALVRGLDELWQRRLIREQGTRAYDFSHDKLREAVYVQVSPARRRQLHRHVAQALEQVDAADLDPVSGQIAAHYEQAGLLQPAADFYTHAADVAQRIYAHADAVSYLTKALALLEQLPRTPDRLRQALWLHFVLAGSQTLLHGVSSHEVEAVYRRAHVLAEQVEDDLLHLRALLGQEVSAMTRGQVREARALGEEALAFARQIENPLALGMAQVVLGISILQCGEWQASRRLLEQSAAFKDEELDPAWRLVWPHHVGLGNRRHLAMALWHLGYPDQAVQLIDATVVQATEIAHLYSLAAVLQWSVWLHQLRREPALVQAQAEQVVTLARQHNFPYWYYRGLVLEGWARMQQGQVAAGIARMEEGLSAKKAMAAHLHAPPFMVMLAEAYGRAGEPARGLAILDEALAQVVATGERFGEAEIYRYQGELRLMQGAPTPEVEALLLRGLAVARQQEAKSLELRAALSLARLWQQRRRSEAHDLLAGVYTWFSEGFDTADLIDARTLLAALA